MMGARIIPQGFEVAAADWNAVLAGRSFDLSDWMALTFGEQAAYAARSPVVTFTVSIARNGDVTNDTQTYGSTFAEVYRAFHAIKAEIERQIAERRACPYNPAHGASEPVFDDAASALTGS